MLLAVTGRVELESFVVTCERLPEHLTPYGTPLS
jgi:hypothetical protein